MLQSALLLRRPVSSVALVEPSPHSLSSLLDDGVAFPRWRGEHRTCCPLAPGLTWGVCLQSGGSRPGLGDKAALHSPPCGDAPTPTPCAGGKGLSCWAHSQLSPALPPPRPPSLSVPASSPSVDLCVSCV